MYVCLWSLVSPFLSLQAGAKCKARVLEGGSRATVSFSAIPLRAGSLRLPVVRLVCRPARPAGLLGDRERQDRQSSEGLLMLSRDLSGGVPPVSSFAGYGGDCLLPWYPALDGDSVTASRDILVLPKLVSTPDVRLLQE